jgi:ADP-ribosylglycohydrolase
MRSAILGVVFGEDVSVLSDWVLRSTRITHSDPKAFYGALTVAIAAHISSLSKNILPREFIRVVDSALAGHESREFIELLRKAAASAEDRQKVGDFARSIGSKRGISGYIYHTVPCVIQVWLRYQTDFAGGIQDILSAGGDTDTTGSILGAIIGARVGKDGIPEKWRSRIWEWPRKIKWMERLGYCLAASLQGETETKSPGYFVPGVLLRNLVFFMVVLFHALRRLAPPY